MLRYKKNQDSPTSFEYRFVLLKTRVKGMTFFFFFLCRFFQIYEVLFRFFELFHPLELFKLVFFFADLRGLVTIL